MYTYRWNNDKMKFDVLDSKGNYVTDFLHAIDAKNYCKSANEELRNAFQK